MKAYINGRAITLQPNMSIGKGGEADVYKISDTQAVKIFKPPDHPDYTNFPLAQKAAQERIAMQQTKLLAFPAHLPKEVIVPMELAKDKTEKMIIGYTMNLLSNNEPLLKFSDKTFRLQGIEEDNVVGIFRRLRQAVIGVHKQKVEIGDFNDLNVLVVDNTPYLIDADSFQFDRFPSTMFTEKFLDPMLVNQNSKVISLHKRYNQESDWYAFAVMLLQSLLFVGPYGGIYKPKDKKARLSPTERVMKRKTIFQPDVIYPRPARHYRILPDDLLHYFQKIFEQDVRGQFPEKLLSEITWKRCEQCGLLHARKFCPDCSMTAEAAIVATVLANGRLLAEKIFSTKGLVLEAVFHGHQLQWLFHEKGKYVLGGGQEVVKGALDPKVRYKLQGNKVLIGRDDTLYVVEGGREINRQAVDRFRNLPLFAANQKNWYWISNGELYENGEYSPKHIGTVLENQTLFWVGNSFGFGFYRAGRMTVAFTFYPGKRGIKDDIKLPPLAGQIIDAICYFSQDRCWLFLSVQEQGVTVNRCFVIGFSGEIIATAETVKQNDGWLDNVRGKCAAGKFLFSATDEGMVRLEDQKGKIVLTREYPETEKYVNARTRLICGNSSMFAVNDQEIHSLKMI